MWLEGGWWEGTAPGQLVGLAGSCERPPALAGQAGRLDSAAQTCHDNLPSLPHPPAPPRPHPHARMLAHTHDLS